MTKAMGIDIKGLSYTTKDATLKFDFPLGVSNEFTGKKAEISVKEGTIIVIWQGNLEALL